MSQPTAGVDLDDETTAGAVSDAAPASAEPVTDTAAPTDTPRGPVRRLFGRLPGEVYALAFMAALTRFALLYNPRAIVFDEIYFREYSLHYKAGTYYFDLHPPLGKLMIGLWGAIAGVPATAMSKDPAVALRIFPAFCGTLLILVVYALIRNLSGSRRVATLGAGLLLLENALLTESRLILIDSQLLLYGVGAVTLALYARKRTGRAYWLMFIGAAVLAGMAVSTKVTGVASLGLVGVLWLVDLYERREVRRALAQLAVLALVPITVYTGVMAVHLALLPKSGPGDVYMPQDFQATLKGNAAYRPDAHLSFFKKYSELNKSMHDYELSINGTVHPYSSKWYTWPVAKRGVYMYLGTANDGKSRYIYQLPNPVVWWGILAGVLVVIGGIFARPKRFKPYKWPLAFLFVAWLANFLPFVLIVRPMFLYHYFYALIFSLSFVVIGLGALTGWIKDDGGKPFTFPSRASALGYWGILGAALLGFLYFAPLTYALPLSPEGLNARMWLHTWR